jgi:hypothetical protein
MLGAQQHKKINARMDQRDLLSHATTSSDLNIELPMLTTDKV